MKSKNISVEALQERLNKNQPVFILDVRPEEQREEWHIPESVHRDAYAPLNNGDNSVLDDIQIPENTPVVTVCAAGRTSQIASEVLRNKGIEAYSLEGGMKAWNYAWNTASVTLPDSGIHITQVRRVAKGCLSYVIGSGNEAIVIDAALDPEVYLTIARQHGWHIRYVMDTHIHADYLSRTRELSSESGAKHLFIKHANVDYPFTPVKDGEKITFGNAAIEILHTPGHTPESTCYLIGGEALLTGDTLFTDGVGRPDLKADHAEAAQKASRLFDSLQRILKLSEDVIILSAHTSGAVSFDGKMIQAALSEISEKVNLLHLPREEFVETTLKRIPPAPPNYLTIAALNRKGDFEGYQPAELEAGANRCAVS